MKGEPMNRKTGKTKLRRLSAVHASNAARLARAGEFKRLREEMHISQEALAKMLGLSFATVNRKENGHSPITQIEMAALKGLWMGRAS